MTGLMPPGPLAYSGQVAMAYIQKTFAPTSNDTNFNIPTIWVDTSTEKAYILLSKALNVATWVLFAGTSGDIETLTADNAVAVGPSSTGNINIDGTSTQGISTSGNAGTNTITITASDASTTQKGVVELSTNALAIAGSSTTTAVTPAALAAKLGTQTAHGVLVAEGTSSALTALSVGTDGQVLLGSSTADPAFATVTSSAGTLTYTRGAHSLNIDVASPLAVAYGGTGDASIGAYAPVCGGTSITGPFQSATTGFSSSGYVLTSAGSSALPTWQLPGLYFIGELTASTSASLAFTTGLTAFKVLLVVFDRIFPTVNDSTFNMQLSNDGGVTYSASSYTSGVNVAAYNSSTLTNYNSTTSWQLTGEIDNTSGNNYANGSFCIYGVNVADIPYISGTVSYYDGSLTSVVFGNVGGGGGTSGLNAIKFFMSSGNIATAGRVAVYGLGGS